MIPEEEETGTMHLVDSEEDPEILTIEDPIETLEEIMLKVHKVEEQAIELEEESQEFQEIIMVREEFPEITKIKISKKKTEILMVN